MKFMLGGGIGAVALMLVLLLRPQLDAFGCFVRRLSNLERAFLAGFLGLFVAYGGTKPPTPPEPPAPTVYAIAYDLAGGVNAEANPANYTTNDLPIVLAAPTREGYDFAGWVPSGEIAVGTTGDLTFKATWEKQEEPPTPPEPPVVEPVVTNTVTYLGLEGAANPNPATFTTNDLPLALAPLERKGYTFLGWTPDGGVISAGTVTNVTFTANWEKQEGPPPEPPVVEPVVTNTVTYLGLEGAANPNPATFTTNDLPLALAPLEREGYAFLGWTPDGGVIPAGTVTNVTFTANWEKQEEPPTPERKAIVDDLAEIDDLLKFPATTYDGNLYDEESGTAIGTIQVKAAKAKYNKKTKLTTTKLTIGIQLVNEKKKVSISGEYDLDAGGEQSFTKKGRTVTLRLGSNGLLGSFEGCAVEAVANVFLLKDARSKEKAKNADAAYVGSCNVFSEEGSLTVSVAKKGKAKVAGTLSDGTKLSASAQLLVGDGIACATFVVPKKNLAFAVWFGEETTVVGLTDPVVGKGSDLAGPNAFYADVEGLMEALEAAIIRPLADFVPYAVSVASTGKKWTVANGAKAGKIKYDKVSGEAWDDKASANPAGLSLSYSAKTGTFTGSFKVYGIVKGKLKSYTAKVTGVLVNGRGYGYAIISKVGGAVVWIEPDRGSH